MVATPSNHGGILHCRVCHVVIYAGSIFIAYSLCVPRKTHRLRAISNRNWEGWDGSSLDFVTNGFCLQRACLVRAKESLIELSIFHA